MRVKHSQQSACVCEKEETEVHFSVVGYKVCFKEENAEQIFYSVHFIVILVCDQYK